MADHDTTTGTDSTVNPVTAADLARQDLLARLLVERFTLVPRKHVPAPSRGSEPSRRSPAARPTRRAR